MFRAALRPAMRHLKLRNARPFHNGIIKKTSNVTLITSIAGLTGYLMLDNYLTKVQCAVRENILKSHEIIREDLPFITEEELAKHDNKYHIVSSPGVDTFDIIGNAMEVEREAGIWVSYGVGVYDITKLIDRHGNPNDTILLAAGMSIDPFWQDEDMKKIHETKRIFEMLEKCRVGNLEVKID